MIKQKHETQISGLYTICDISYSQHTSHLQLAEEILAGGAPILQLRMKGEKDLAKVKATALAIQQLQKKYSFTFILNDFVKIAAEIKADGVHVGQDDLSITAAREIVGADTLIGYSSHSLTEALEAEQAGADYVALGAIYPTATKGPNHPVVGIKTLNQIVQQLRVPVVAIGGINTHNLAEVMATGVHAIAMITALTQAENVSQATQNMMENYQRYLIRGNKR